MFGIKFVGIISKSDSYPGKPPFFLSRINVENNASGTATSAKAYRLFAV